MNNHKWALWAAGALLALSTTMGGAALTWMFTMSERMTILEQRAERDNRQDATLSKHWKLHSWARDRLYEERVARGEQIDPWPDLDN